MKITDIFRNQIFGWTLYCLLILGLVMISIHIVTFNEKDIYYFNSDLTTHKPIIDIDVINIDCLSNTINCVITIPRYYNLNIRAVHVSSWEWPDFMKEMKLGPDFEAYFIYPSEEEIYRGDVKDIDNLNRKFQFKVSGNPVLYPFDRYKSEFGIWVLNASKQEPKAVSIKVTTKVHEYLPGFYITDVKDMLTFQKEAEDFDELGIIPKNTFSFTLVRGKFIRLFTVYIYTIAFIFLIYIGFRRSTNELLIQSMGYFAALWGIRNIISGKIEIFPTIIDYLTLILFTMLVLIITGKLLQEYYKQNIKT